MLSTCMYMFLVKMSKEKRVEVISKLSYEYIQRYPNRLDRKNVFMIKL